MNRFAFLLVAIFCISAAAQAETIQISVSKQAPHKQVIDRPANGMNKNDVERIYGPPREITETIGNPPISMWIYKDFSVYFEYDLVLHTVLQPDNNAN